MPVMSLVMSVTLKENDRVDSSREPRAFSNPSEGLLKHCHFTLLLSNKSTVFASLVAIVPKPGLFLSRNFFFFNSETYIQIKCASFPLLPCHSGLPSKG